MSRKKKQSRHSPRKGPRSLPGWTRWAALALVLVIAIVVVLANKKGGLQEAFTQSTRTPLPYIVSVNRAYVMYTEEGAFLLDVRTNAEWDSHHIPDTDNNHVTNIPLDELPSRLNEIPRSATIVVICATGLRSDKGRDILLNAGYPSVTSMSGGMQAWIDNNLPVEGIFSY